MVYTFQGINPKIHASVFQAPGSRIIGDVEIGKNSSVWFNTVIRGDINSIRIGEGTSIQDGSVVHVTHKTAPTVIGNNVTIGHMVMLHGCTIHDFVLVGMQSTVLDGADIGEESLIGACSMITQGIKIPPRSLVLGAPAKVVRPLKDEEIRLLHQSAENYKQYVRWYMEGGFSNA
jgi:carbonic anhydrase/acetyltransferase-like protein (isoleucine patch superfamily)